MENWNPNFSDMDDDELYEWIEAALSFIEQENKFLRNIVDEMVDNAIETKLNNQEFDEANTVINHIKEKG